jgi:triacylglycerol lipase
MLPPTKTPRLAAPIVLAHGLFGFTRVGLGPITLTPYFRSIPQELIAAGNRVLITRVPSIAGVERRAGRLGEQILKAFPNEPVHVIGHSMGGLDARQLLANPSWRRRILSLSTIGTPHLGTALADFAKLRVGRIFRLLSSMGIDPQGCLDVTRSAARRFNRRHAAPADLPCFSIAGIPTPETVCWPLTRTFAALSELEGTNDGLVPVHSARAFGTPLPHWPVDHLRQMNWMERDELHPALAPPVELYAHLVAHLASLGFATASCTEERLTAANGTARSEPPCPSNATGPAVRS